MHEKMHQKDKSGRQQPKGRPIVAETTHSENPGKNIGPVLGRMPSGVFVLTVSDGKGRETGMLASWVQQASFEPPMLTLAVKKERYVNDWLQATGRAALSVVAEKQHGFLKHFAAGFAPDEAAFEGLNVARSEAGLPVLSESLGWLEGTVAGRTEAGDHYLYVLKLTAAGAAEDPLARRPMVHVRRNGLKY